MLGGVEIPYLPDNEPPQPWLERGTTDIRMVSKYTGLNFNEVIQLDCITYKMLMRDAFIEQMSQSEDGREYLHSAWLLTQTEPDIGTLRQMFGKE